MLPATARPPPARAPRGVTGGMVTPAASDLRNARLLWDYLRLAP
jgi:hypothetical protein